MNDEQKIIDVCRYTTIYEAITAIMKDQLSIEEMKRMISSLHKYVEAEEIHMRRK